MFEYLLNATFKKWKFYTTTKITKICNASLISMSTLIYGNAMINRRKICFLAKQIIFNRYLWRIRRYSMCVLKVKEVLINCILAYVHSHSFVKILFVMAIPRKDDVMVESK